MGSVLKKLLQQVQKYKILFRIRTPILYFVSPWKGLLNVNSYDCLHSTDGPFSVTLLLTSLCLLLACPSFFPTPLKKTQQELGIELLADAGPLKHIEKFVGQVRFQSKSFFPHFQWYTEYFPLFPEPPSIYCSDNYQAKPLRKQEPFST